MERIEEFSRDGKNFIYVDFSGFKSGADFTGLIEVIKPVITKYPKNSIFTIANMENVRLDSGTKLIAKEFMEHNKPYVKYSVIIGVDGIKKHMVSTVAKLSGRNNTNYTFSKDQAIEWLLRQEP